MALAAMKVIACAAPPPRLAQHLTIMGSSGGVAVQQDGDDSMVNERPARLPAPSGPNPGPSSKKKRTAGGGKRGIRLDLRITKTSAIAGGAVALVSHEYVDHLEDPLFGPPSPRVGVKEAFPFKLHKMLQEAVAEEFDTVVSWLPHGRAFRVHDREKFIQDIMPRFFQQTKITSFNRQLCLYGFVRLTASGDDRGAYYNELCIRSRPDLLRRLQRTRIKGTGKKAASSPQTEPDFYRMPFCPEENAPTIRPIAHQGPPPTSPETTTTDIPHATTSSIKLVTPNPSPRRTQSLSIERLSTALFPKSVLTQPMLPPSYQLLPFIPQPPLYQPFLAVPEEEDDYGSSSDAYLDSNQFSFAWDDVDV